jgi:acetylornithine deacetylase/succinyl-diaminopimelate desuccinylase-like protein
VYSTLLYQYVYPTLCALCHAERTLEEYISIPSQSPAFDADWETNGYLDRTVQLFAAWVESRGVPGLRMEIVKEPKRTPLIFIEVPGTIDSTVLMYGHLDKQPPMTGWVDGLGPYTPVVRDGKLYGRGGADDGYAVFAAITALEALRQQGVARARAVIIIEACEESGSPDLPHYVTLLKERIGTPSLIVCLDSGCGNYEQSKMASLCLCKHAFFVSTTHALR